MPYLDLLFQQAKSGNARQERRQFLQSLVQGGPSLMMPAPITRDDSGRNREWSNKILFVWNGSEATYDLLRPVPLAFPVDFLGQLARHPIQSW